MVVVIKTFVAGLVITGAAWVRIHAPIQQALPAVQQGIQDWQPIPVWNQGYFPQLPALDQPDPNPTSCEWVMMVHPYSTVDNQVVLVGNGFTFETIDFDPIADPQSHRWSGPSDYNMDGDPGTDLDIQNFWSCLSGHCCTVCSADFDGDGNVGTDQDIEVFYKALAGFSIR